MTPSHRHSHAPRSLPPFACALFLLSCSDQEVVLGPLPQETQQDSAIDASAPYDATLASTSQPLKCVAGVYEGISTGYYRSEPGGVCGFTAGALEQGSGRWSFTLHNQGDSEFYVVRGGCLRFPDKVFADGGTNYGHQAEMTGQVNCATGIFEATLRGTYVAVGVCDLGQVWNHYFYKGTMRGRFDPERNAFVDATYQIAERAPILGGEPNGGGGTWTGSLMLDAGVPPSDPGSCLSIEFPEDLKPRPLRAP